ncbi:MAG: hypothetical protein C4K58_03690 [Flavobacteriaceae bacterium]|nr:MAG: hypothetical protein C4K58_03690 [Flavobacteriaceae bacterium]
MKTSNNQNKKIKTMNNKYIFPLGVLLFFGLYFFTPVGEKLQQKILSLKSDAGLEAPLESESGKTIDQSAVLLESLDGKQVDLNQFKGKVVFLNLWATWCGPCVAEMPTLQALSDKYKDKVVFLFVSVDHEPELVAPFIKENRYTMPVYLPLQALPDDIRPSSIPTTYVFNKKSEIVLQDNGARDWNTPEVHQVLDQLILE